MGKQILNRREAIYADEIPPEIADTSGFIKATSYATDTTGGTVKVDDDYGVEVTSAGFLRGTVETAEDYAEAGNNLLVSKGTLDAVLAAQPAPPTGGMTLLYTMPEVEADQITFNAAVTLNATSEGYNALFILSKRGDYITPHFISNVQNGHNVCCTVGNPGSPSFSMRDFKPNGNAISFNSGGDANSKWYAVYGVK